MRRREVLKAAGAPFLTRRLFAAAPRFQFELLHEKPVFDISPHHARMCSCYQDRSGVYHLFTDFIPASAVGTGPIGAVGSPPPTIQKVFAVGAFGLAGSAGSSSISRT